MTKIEWTRGDDGSEGKTWNPVTGCGNGHFNGAVKCHDDALAIPLRWRKPRRIFVNSMSDLFHENVPFAFIDKVFATMALCPQHTFQVLTKRIDRAAEYLLATDRRYSIHAAMERLCSTLEDGTIPAKLDPIDGRKFIVPRRLWAAAPAFPLGIEWPFPNLWLGTSCEDQKTANERIPHLLRCPAAVRFLSCEPLLGPIVLDGGEGFLRGWHCEAVPARDSRGELYPEPTQVENEKIDWVIVGGESGPGARPCNIDWIRNIVAQCKAAGVAAFVRELTCLNAAAVAARQRIYAQPKGGIAVESNRKFIVHARTDIPDLLAEVERLREELVETYDSAMRDVAHYMTDGKHPGWWSSMANSSALRYGDRLVELGKWEKLPAGIGRIQYYRPVEKEAAQGRTRRIERPPIVVEED